MENNLENINSHLLKCMSDINEKKIILDDEINEYSNEKNLLESDIKILKDRLDQVNDMLTLKKLERDHYNKRISKSQTAYDKICNSTNILLTVLNQN